MGKRVRKQDSGRMYRRKEVRRRRRGRAGWRIRIEEEQKAKRKLRRNIKR